MKVFHEHYMPSNDILRPVMEIFLGRDIAMIAPQHGSIINSDVKKYIRALRDLDCGAFLTPIRKELSKSGGYMRLCSAVLQRYGAIFSRPEVLDAVTNLDITVNHETLEISDYNYTGDVLWNRIFEQISIKKGIQWLIVAEPFVQKLSREYDIPMPAVFETRMKEVYELNEENQQLKEINKQLENGIRETKERLIRCPVTGLYNYEFFKDYLSTELNANRDGSSPALVIINLDNMAKIRFSYGDSEVDEVNLDVIKTFLENLKYEVLTAKDGETALALAESELPDAVITEIMLPKKDAFLVRESLLMQSQTKSIPYIIVSHLKDENSVKRALSLQVEHYLKKPFMLSELLGIIKLKIKGDAYQ